MALAKACFFLRAGPVGMECQRGHTLAKGVVFSQLTPLLPNMVWRYAIQVSVPMWPLSQPSSRQSFSASSCAICFKKYLVQISTLGLGVVAALLLGGAVFITPPAPFRLIDGRQAGDPIPGLCKVLGAGNAVLWQSPRTAPAPGWLHSFHRPAGSRSRLCR